MSPDLYAPSGRGIMFMRALMDRVEFETAGGGGTLVRLVKHHGGAA
jgi:anti-sigma regulatory factor (Ser/Thr protein kinase)